MVSYFIVKIAADDIMTKSGFFQTFHKNNLCLSANFSPGFAKTLILLVFWYQNVSYKLYKHIFTNHLELLLEFCGGEPWKLWKKSKKNASKENFRKPIGYSESGVHSITKICHQLFPGTLFSGSKFLLKTEFFPKRDVKIHFLKHSPKI